VKTDQSVERTDEAPARQRSQLRERLARLDAVLLATIVGGAVLRFWAVGAQSFWYDEWLTAEGVSGGLRDLLDHVAKREGTPLPYYLLIWGWAHVFGDGETALRSVSVLAGIATIPVAYWLALELRQRRMVARIAALLVAINPMLVWYSQEARPYSLLAFFGALSMLALARVLNRGQTRDFVMWGLACAGALAVHYYAGFLIVAEAGAILLLRPRRWRRVFLASLPGAVLLAVLAPIALEQRSHTLEHLRISDWTLDERLAEAGRAALAGPGSPRDGLWIVAAVLAAVAAVLVVTHGTGVERSAAALLVGVAGAAVLMPVAAVVVGFDIFLSRYVIGALVPLIVAASIGFGARRAAWVGAVAVTVVCAIWLAVVVAVARDPDLQKPEWRAVADVLESGKDTRAFVMTFHGYAGNALRYYSDGVRSLADGETAGVDEIDVLVHNAKEKPCDFLVGRVCSLLFLGGPLPEPLASQFTLVHSYKLDQLTVNRYRADQLIPVTKGQLVAPGNPADALVLVRS
jgi:uncharacterized membrane protein